MIGTKSTNETASLEQNPEQMIDEIIKKLTAARS
jgi:hypothetical protein